MNPPSPYLVLCDAHDPEVGVNDCGACPSLRTAASAPRCPAELPVERHPQQRELALDDGHVVAFVPSQSRVAVLDTAARRLLHNLARPRRLAELAPPEAAAVAALFAAGLLRPKDAPDEPPAPPTELVAWMHVTNACPLRCTYCYVDKTDEAMAPETGEAAVDAVVRSALAGGYKGILLKYAGGEASLNMQLVERLQRYAAARTAAVGLRLRGVVLSGGVGLTARRLATLRDLGLGLTISLDGPQDIHDRQRPTLQGRGSFRTAARAAEHARAIGLDPLISITVTGASVGGLPELLEWALDRELRFQLNLYREHERSSSRAELQLDAERIVAGLLAAYATIERRPPRWSLLNALLDRAALGTPHRTACPVGENYLVVGHTGAVARCQQELDRPVTTVWQPDPLRTIRLSPVGVRNLPVEERGPECAACDYRYWCAGGCPQVTYRATGRYDLKSPNCSIYLACIPHVLRLEGKRLMQQAGLIGSKQA